MPKIFYVTHHLSVEDESICGTAGKLEVEISYGTEEDDVRQVSEYHEDKDVLDKVCAVITVHADVVVRVHRGRVVCHALTT